MSTRRMWGRVLLDDGCIISISPQWYWGQGRSWAALARALPSARWERVR